MFDGGIHIHISRSQTDSGHEGTMVGRSLDPIFIDTQRDMNLLEPMEIADHSGVTILRPQYDHLSSGIFLPPPKFLR